MGGGAEQSRGGIGRTKQARRHTHTQERWNGGNKRGTRKAQDQHSRARGTEGPLPRQHGTARTRHHHTRAPEQPRRGLHTHPLVHIHIHRGEQETSTESKKHPRSRVAARQCTSPSCRRHLLYRRSWAVATAAESPTSALLSRVEPRCPSLQQWDPAAGKSKSPADHGRVRTQLVPTPKNVHIFSEGVLFLP